MAEVAVGAVPHPCMVDRKKPNASLTQADVGRHMLGGEVLVEGSCRRFDYTELQLPILEFSGVKLRFPTSSMIKETMCLSDSRCESLQKVSHCVERKLFCKYRTFALGTHFGPLGHSAPKCTRVVNHG
ncbi:uncharacterized protein LOC144003094 [Festucalex cinctus]